MNLCSELYAHACNINVISTHSHHDYHEAFENFNLKALTYVSYPKWYSPALKDLEESEYWKRYFEINSCCSSSYWLNRALGDIYLDGTPMCLENYKEIDARMREKYTQDPYFHEKIITDICHLETLIMDEHRDPGMTHDLPFVRPSMRMDWALSASSHAKQLLGNLPDSFSEYLDAVDAFIDKRVREQGVVAFKLACAYERPLDFKKVSYEEAEQAYLSDKNRNLGDYMVYHICELALSYDLPFQFHTGYGQLRGTAALNLLELIRDFPDLKFVLLHCSFPWTADSIALAYTLPNVYIDLSWLFTVSDAAGRRYLQEAFDAVPLDRFAWGCDTWTAEEGYGALLAVRHALANEFSRRVGEGLLTISYAKRGIEMILHDNPKELYKL